MVVRYKDPIQVVSSPIQAKDMEEARLICSQAVESYEKMMSEMESKNVFISSRIVDFSVEPELENNV